MTGFEKHFPTLQEGEGIRTILQTKKEGGIKNISPSNNVKRIKAIRYHFDLFFKSI